MMEMEQELQLPFPARQLLSQDAAPCTTMNI